MTPDPSDQPVIRSDLVTKDELGARLQAIDHRFESFEGSIEKLDQSIDRLSDKIDEAIASGKTDWGILAKWTTVILTIVGLVIAPLLWQMIDNKGAIDRHSAMEGHPTALAVLEWIMDDVQDLDEWRDRFRENQEEDRGLARWMQGKLDTEVKHLQDGIRSLEERVNRLDRKE